MPTPTSKQPNAQLFEALIAFQAEVPAIKKDSTNPFFKSKYASLDTIVETIKPLMKKHGLGFMQFPAGENELKTVIIHKSGEALSDSCKLELVKNTPQDQGSAITYMRRYALSAALGLVTEDDTDGEMGQHTPKPQKAQPAAAAAPQEAPQTATSGAPSCPECNSPMKERNGPRGPFYGCTRYPDCRGILNKD